MKLSTRTRYGVRLMFELALHYKQGAIQLNDIAESQDISEKYLGQIVIQLKQAGLISSTRGAQGGYFLTRLPEEVSIADIVEKLEGGLEFVECISNKSYCNRCNSCVANRLWSILSDTVKTTLNGISLATLVEWHTNSNRELNFII